MQDYATYTIALQDLQVTLETELNSFATYNSTTDNWELTLDTSLGDVPDQNEQADAAEDTEERVAVLTDLETRYRNVVRALQKITAGNYGVCEISGEPIESARLVANPAARTCIAHRDQEANLPR